MEQMQHRVQLVRVHTLEQLMCSLVRKAAWHLDRAKRSATLRLEIGAGPLQGAIVLIHANPAEIRVELDAPPDIDLEVWKNRLKARLASRQLAAAIS